MSSALEVAAKRAREREARANTWRIVQDTTLAFLTATGAGPTRLGELIPFISRMGARVAKLVPGLGFTEPTISEEVAKRRGESVEAAHAWMLTPMLTSGNQVVRAVAEHQITQEFDFLVGTNQTNEQAQVIANLPKGDRLRAKLRKRRK